MNETFKSLLRHGLTTAGALLVTKGWADEGMVNEAAGAIVALVGLGWSIYRAVKNKKATPAA